MSYNCILKIINKTNNNNPVLIPISVFSCILYCIIIIQIIHNNYAKQCFSIGTLSLLCDVLFGMKYNVDIYGAVTLFQVIAIAPLYPLAFGNLMVNLLWLSKCTIFRKFDDASRLPNSCNIHCKKVIIIWHFQ